MKYYKGEIINNKANGLGKITFTNNDYYEGNFINNIKIGKGLYISKKNNVELMYNDKGEEIFEETKYNY